MSICECGCGLNKPSFSGWKPEPTAISKIDLFLLTQDMEKLGWTDNAQEYVKAAVVFYETRGKL